jgi:hypothetical protein
MNDTALASTHPSPHRDRVDIGWLFFGVFAGPVAWGLQLVINYALAAYPCFPDGSPRVGVLPGWHAAWAIILALNIIAALLALAGAAISHQNWHAAREEHHGPASHALEAGEGRTRFLALCGMMTGFGFFAAIIFNTISVLMVPQCSG